MCFHFCTIICICHFQKSIVARGGLYFSKHNSLCNKALCIMKCIRGHTTILTSWTNPCKWIDNHSNYVHYNLNHRTMAKKFCREVGLLVLLWMNSSSSLSACNNNKTKKNYKCVNMEHMVVSHQCWSCVSSRKVMHMSIWVTCKLWCDNAHWGSAIMVVYNINMLSVREVRFTFPQWPFCTN